MKINSIHYEKVFPIAPYQNEKIGIEIQVDEGEKPFEVFEFAKSMVEGWHKLGNSSARPENQPFTDKPYTDELPVVDINDINRDADMSKEPFYINSKIVTDCKTMEELARIKPNLPKALMPNYMNKLKQLTNGIHSRV